MHFTKKTVSEKRSDLIKSLKSKKLLRFPGAYNPLCAKLIAEIGFDFKFLIKSERFSETVFLVKCIRKDLY